MREIIIWKASRGNESCHFGAYGPAKAWSGADGKVEELRVRAAELTVIENEQMARIDLADLSMLVARLASALRKAMPGNDLSDKAIDYLKRHGLQGTVVRQDNGGTLNFKRKQN